MFVASLTGCLCSCVCQQAADCDAELDGDFEMMAAAAMLQHMPANQAVEQATALVLALTISLLQPLIPSMFIKSVAACNFTATMSKGKIGTCLHPVKMSCGL